MEEVVCMKSQAARSAERRLLDKADAIACAERAGNCCEMCGYWCPYTAMSIYAGSNHHARKKRTEEDRRNRDWHIWLCAECHTLAHASDGQHIRERCEEIIQRRETQ